jgi:hypothetical protein
MDYGYHRAPAHARRPIPRADVVILPVLPLPMTMTPDTGDHDPGNIYAASRCAAMI